MPDADRAQAAGSGAREAQHVQEAPARHGQQPRQRAVQPAAAAPVIGGSTASAPARSERCRGARPAGSPRARARSRYSPIGRSPGMLGEVRRANQPPGEQEVHARLQVREVRHRDEQLAAGRDHAKQLRERPRLVGERQMLEHVEAQRAIERRRRRRAARSAIRGVTCADAVVRDRRLRSRGGRGTRRRARPRRSRRRARACPRAARDR